MTNEKSYNILILVCHTERDEKFYIIYYWEFEYEKIYIKVDVKRLHVEQ